MPPSLTTAPPLPARPVLSLLTPTYDRHRFLPLLAHMIDEQQYDLSTVEWVVVDDSPTDLRAWFDAHPLHQRLFRLSYVHLPHKVTVGCKRNLTKTLAAGDYLLHMDDDDYYATNYIRTVMAMFTAEAAPAVIGATTISLMYPHTLFLYDTWPPKRNHTCAGILSYTRAYADAHHFPNAAVNGEEPGFLQGNPVAQITDAHNVYMAFVHAYNTVPKKRVQRIPTTRRWTDVVQLPKVALFYLTLHAAHLPLATQLVPRLPTLPPNVGDAPVVDVVRQRYGYQFIALTVLQALLRLVRRVVDVVRAAVEAGVTEEVCGVPVDVRAEVVGG